MGKYSTLRVNITISSHIIQHSHTSNVTIHIHVDVHQSNLTINIDTDSPSTPTSKATQNIHPTPSQKMESLTFLPPSINFSSGDSFLRLQPITDFRQCHGTIPHESRILYHCRRVNSKSPPSPPAPSSKLKNDDRAHEEDGEQEDFILKIKIQIPSPDSSSSPQNSLKNSPDHHHLTPSPPTLHEQHALSLFQQTKTPDVPHLLATQTTPQPSSSPFLPDEGYISYTVMTRLPGKSLFEIGYWSLEPEVREEIRREFLVVLRWVCSLSRRQTSIGAKETTANPEPLSSDLS